MHRALIAQFSSAVAGDLRVIDKLKPEDKVRITIEMVDAVTRISADNEREKDPKITEAELIARVRHRFRRGQRFPAR
jgi:RecB family endonuclease NucS